MAPFIPADKFADQAPNYLGFSRGFDKGDVGADTSLAKMFSSLGELIGPATSGVDQSIKAFADNDIREAVENVRSAHGGNLKPEEVIPIAGTGARGRNYEAVADIPELGANLEVSPAITSDVKTTLTGLNRMKQAYQAGELSSSHYWSSMEAEASRLRNKYRGYEEYIDKEFSQQTGSIPANALRASILSDMVSMQNANSAADNRLRSIYMSEGPYIDRAFGAKVSFDQFRQNPDHFINEANAVKAEDLHTTHLNSRLKLSEDQGKANKDLAFHTYNTAATTYVSQVTRPAMNQLEGRLKQLQQQAAVGQVDSKALGQFVADASVLKTHMEAELYDMSIRPIVTGMDSNGNPQISNISYSKYLTPEQRKQVVQGALEPIDTMIKAAAGNDVNVMNMAGNLLKAQGSNDFLRLTQQIPATRAWSAMNQHLGGQMMSQLMILRGTSVSEPLVKAVTDLHWLGTAGDKTTTTPPPTASDAAKAVVGAHPQDPGGEVKKLLQGFKIIATNPEDMDAARRAVQTLYDDPNLFKLVRPEEHRALYELLGSQDVTTAMVNLRSSDEQSFNKYADWMERNFKSVFSQSLTDAQSAIQYNKYDWSFDGKQFSGTVKPEFQSTLMTDPMTLLNPLNQNLKLLNPVLEARYGEQAGTKLMDLLRASGLNPDAPQRGGFFEELDKTLKGVTGAPLKGKTEKRSEGPVTGLVQQVADRSASLEDIRGSANAAHVSEEWGNPLKKGFVSDHLTTIKTPGGISVKVNTKAAEAFQGFLTDLEATGYKIDDIGGYSLRTNKSNPRQLSQHAFGNAIDINPDQNPFMRGRLKTNMPANVGELAAKWGLSWGGDWTSVKDPMHFEYTGKTPKIPAPADTRVASLDENP